MNISVSPIPEPIYETDHIAWFRPGFQPGAHKRLGIQELVEAYSRRKNPYIQYLYLVTYTYPNKKKFRKTQKFPENPVT